MTCHGCILGISGDSEAQSESLALRVCGRKLASASSRESSPGANSVSHESAGPSLRTAAGFRVTGNLKLTVRVGPVSRHTWHRWVFYGFCLGSRVRRRRGGRGAAGPGRACQAEVRLRTGQAAAAARPPSQAVRRGWPRRAGGPGPGPCCNLPRSLINSGPGEMKGGPSQPGSAMTRQLNLNVLKSHSHG